MKYPKRIQRLLNKPEKERTISEKEYLNWYGATGHGLQLRNIIARECKEER